jgi:hypothetical protein
MRLDHSLITLVAAGASGFLTLSQSGERPERYGRPRRLATMPSSPTRPTRCCTATTTSGHCIKRASAQIPMVRGGSLDQNPSLQAEHRGRKSKSWGDCTNPRSADHNPIASERIRAGIKVSRASKLDVRQYGLLLQYSSAPPISGAPVESSHPRAFLVTALCKRLPARLATPERRPGKTVATKSDVPRTF